MTYDDKLAATKIMKILVGADILDSALTDMSVDESKNEELKALIINAKNATSELICAYDEMVKGNADKLSEIYEMCNKSVDWNLKKFINNSK